MAMIIQEGSWVFAAENFRNAFGTPIWCSTIERSKMQNKTLDFLAKFKADTEKAQQLLPGMLKGFGALFQGVMKDGALKTKEKELVALGIAVAQRCEPCISLHVQKCLQAGNTPGEILEAASVAVVMQGGPAYTHIPEVMQALEDLAKSP
jgi:AhpD family alkylhydroperoxidase